MCEAHLQICRPFSSAVSYTVLNIRLHKLSYPFIALLNITVIGDFQGVIFLFVCFEGMQYCVNNFKTILRNLKINGCILLQCHILLLELKLLLKSMHA